MCGIFGLVRNPQATHPEQASAVFAALGVLAEERGRDAAGLAVVRSAPGTDRRDTSASLAEAMRRQVTIGAVSVVKDVVPFSDLWDDDQHLPLLAEARVALGHTRWATQGDRKAVANASPLLVGMLVGTHNGDVDVASISGHKALPAAAGGTDTERLYQALHRARGDRRKITRLLTGLRGRAALAWCDRSRPDRIYLARTALSPVAVAFDAAGNLYWASNPQWFRQVEADFGNTIGFRDVHLLREGALLTVQQGEGSPTFADLRSFTPTCRARDTRLGDSAVWRGFVDADIAIDKAQRQHLVAADPVRRKPAKTLQSAGDRLVPTQQARSAGRSLNRALAAEQPDLWADEWDRTEQDWTADIDLQDEVDEALLDWIDEGCNPQVARRVSQATLPSEQAALAGEYGFSSASAIGLFAHALQQWETLEDATPGR